jgi:NitT/TauT family transport system substrate-binding protein
MPCGQSVGVVALVLLVACSGSAAPPAAAPSGVPTAALPTAAPRPRPLAVGYSAVSGTYLPLWLAQEAGLFAREGLDVELRYASSTALASALVAGEVPLAVIGGVEVLTSNLAGSDMIMIAGASMRPVMALVTRPDVASFAELQGRRVGVSRVGSVTYYGAVLGLRRAGFDPGRDIALVQAGGVPEILPMMESGAADGGVVSPPTWFEAERRGYRELLDFTTLGIDYPQSVVATRRGYVAENRGLVLDFLRGFMAAITLQREDPALAQRVLSQYTRSTDDDILDRTYLAFRDGFLERPAISPAALAPVLALIAAETPAAAQAAPEQFIDNSLVEEIAAAPPRQ